jgi:PAS domain S-box-containing protein
LGIAKDITYEKEIKEELRISYEKLEETVNELKQQQFAIDQHDIVSITDVKGTIIYANDSFCKISKYTKEELIGQNHRIVKSSVHSIDIFTEMYHTIANGKVWKGDLCNMAKDGTLYWVSNTIVPYMDAKTNKPLRYVSIRTDITDKKLAELEREKLLEEVTNNNRELKQFSYITSHNLRAPLTNLLSICNLIKSDSIADPLTKRLIEGFKKSTFDLNDTLNDLISILIIKENINLPTAEIYFDETLEKVVSSINKSVENSKTIINADFSAVQSIIFNPTYLESIFLNLITNAIKYSKPEITPIINIATSKNKDGSTKMVFSDNGIGMNMERVKNKIFGLYQRFHTNADSKGIGLYLIQSQVTALGGKIEFYSEVNIGTTFTLTFK